MAEAAAVLVTKDLNALASIDKSGMVEYLQKIVEIQHDFCQGNGKILNMKKLVPCPQTVHNHVDNLAVKKRKEFAPEMQQALERQELSYTCDLWKDKMNGRDFIAVYAHYFPMALCADPKCLSLLQFFFNRSFRLFVGWERKKVLLGHVEWEAIMEELEDDGVDLENAEELAPKAANKVLVAIARIFYNFGLKVHFEKLESVLESGSFQDENVNHLVEPTGVYNVWNFYVRIT